MSSAIDEFVAGISQAATEIENKRSARLIELASQYRRGKLKDPATVAAELATIARTPEQLRSEVLRQDAVDEQRAVLAGEPGLRKREAACEKKRAEVTAAFELARTQHASAMAAVDAEAVEVHRCLSLVGVARARLTELLSAEEADTVAEIDSRIAALSIQRADLQGLLGSTNRFDHSGGERPRTYFARVAELRTRIRASQEEHRKSQDRGRREQLQAGIAESERAISELDKQVAADQKRLAAIEADLAKATADRERAVAKMLKG